MKTYRFSNTFFFCVLSLAIVGCKGNGNGSKFLDMLTPGPIAGPDHPIEGPNFNPDSTRPFIEQCEGTLRGPGMGSSTVALSEDGGALYAVNRDAGTVTRLDIETQDTEEVEVGAEPTRIARVGNQLIVSLRAERALAVLEDTGDALVLQSVVPTGAEPYGVISHPDEELYYVAVSIEGVVEERAAASHEVLRSWAVSDEPRWLAIHPSGASLYVGSAMQGTLSRIDLTEEDKGEVIALPGLFGGIDGFESGPMGSSFHSGSNGIRITGDLSVSPDGRAVLLPVLHVDNNSPLPSTVDVHDGGEFDNGSGSQSGYASPGRFTPGVTEIPVDEKGELRDDENAVTYRQDTIMLVDPEQSEENAVRNTSSYPTGVVVSSDCTHIAVAMEGSNAISVSRRGDLCHVSTEACVHKQIFDIGGGRTVVAPTTVVVTGSGPTGMAWLDNDLYVHALFDRNMGRIDMTQLRKELMKEEACTPAGLGEHEFFGTPSNGPAGAAIDVEQPTVTISPLPFDASLVTCFYPVFGTDIPVKLTDFSLEPNIEFGRKLFYSSIDTRMSDTHSPVSCSTCHGEARNDGLTWQFEDFPRQTPSLAGMVSLKEPVTWFETGVSVVEEVMITSQGRMGGSGLTEEEAIVIANFIDWTRHIDNPIPDELMDQVVWGEELFFSVSVGCATCHYGPELTDNQFHNVGGITIRTPGLRGVRATAPYFHDAPTESLLELVNWATFYNMGNTEILTDEEREALATYLKYL
ncbi:MAG: hypothetical protein CMH54_05550 [Myxococcales bacterium]|nr:hypothetical protein [Myxococcales bacterium]